jgi:hypothetical protein
MAQEIEVFGFVIQVGIALIAVTITAFSIAVSILGSERARIQTQIEEIYRTANERLGRGEIKNIEGAEAEVKRVHAERTKAANVLSRLSLVNVVLFPCLCFTLSIVVAMVFVGGATGSFGYIGNLMFSLTFMGFGIAFLVNALFAIERAAGQPRPSAKIIEEVPVETGIIAYIFVDSWEKAVVDWNRKIAYFTDSRIDDAIRQGKVKIVPLVGKNRATFVKEKGLTDVFRFPTVDELPL